jgi:preprotein translocase subunit SecA
MMGRFGIPEDEPIQNGIISRSLETAQSRIEGFNFDARKHVLEYDDIMNLHRKTIYTRRNRILLGSTKDILAELSSVIDENDADFMKMINDKKSSLGEEVFASELRRLFLQTIDMFWVEHLEAMDYLRGSVNLRAYGQRDPLVEYKREGSILFKNLLISINSQIVSVLPNLGGTLDVREAKSRAEMEDAARIISSSGGVSVSNDDKKGRNEKIVITKDGEEKEVKWKKLDSYLALGWVEKK